MTRFIMAALICMMLLFNSHAQPRRVQLGYAYIQTVKGSAVAGDPQQMYPGIVVRMFPKRGHGEAFAISNRDGIVLVPLRPGQYCFEAFDGNGTGLALDPKQASCFPITLNKTTDVGVVVRAEQ
jgi:hypothetical protein